MKKIDYILIFFILFAFACQNKKAKPSVNEASEPIQETDSVFTIALDKNINNQGAIGLKEMAAEVQYVKLEYTPQCLLGRILYLVASQNYFFVNGSSGIYQFSRKGKFIRKVGSMGKGPGEYLGFRDFTVDETDQKLYILTNWTREILIYGFDGKYLGKIPLKDDSLEKCDYIADSLLALQIHPLERKSLLSTEVIDEQGNSIMKVNSSVIKHSEIGKWMGSNLVYTFNKKVYVKEFYNDTVFQITSKGLEPYFILKLGKYASPFTYSMEDRKKYIFLNRIFENDQSITIFFLYDDKKCVAQYNKKTGRTKVSIPPNDDPEGIKNDVNDGMLFFRPSVILSLKTTQNEWLCPIEAIKLKEYCNNKDVQGNLNDIISELKAEDNPVIMVVKFN